VARKTALSLDTCFLQRNLGYGAKPHGICRRFVQGGPVPADRRWTGGRGLRTDDTQNGRLDDCGLMPFRCPIRQIGRDSFSKGLPNLTFLNAHEQKSFYFCPLAVPCAVVARRKSPNNPGRRKVVRYVRNGVSYAPNPGNDRRTYYPQGSSL